MSFDGKQQVFLQEASALIFARLEASFAGFKGEFVAAHVLDARSAKKVPKQMIGRALSLREASALLDRVQRSPLGEVAVRDRSVAGCG
jgi:hypothetical protein